MSNANTAQTKRDWFKMALLALLPALAVGLFALGLEASTSEAAAEMAPSSTTTTSLAEATSKTGAAETASAEEDTENESPSQPEGDEPEQEQPQPDEPEQDQPDQEEPEDPPAPASMHLPTEVKADGSGKATIEISNTGEEPLEIYLVDVNDNPIEVGDVSTEVGGGSSADIELTVDTTDLEFGPYEMKVTISTNDGVGNVDVKGTKLAILIPWVPDLDVASAYVLPHQVDHVGIEIVNNTDDSVTIGLGSDDDRLVFPGEVELEPGENTVDVVVQALPLHWSVIDVLELKVSYGAIEMGTVTITKYGS